MKYEDYLGICPNCGDKDFGEHTVLNGAEQVLQVPLFLVRLDKPEHGHILKCSHCQSVYEVDNGIALSEAEVKECKELWDRYTNTGRFQVGTRFIGNVDQTEMEVVKIETPRMMTESDNIIECSPQAVIKNCKTEKTFICGLQALNHCDVTILEK